MRKQGRIPETIKAYLRPAYDMLGAGHAHNAWSFPPDTRETAHFSKCTVNPAFVVPADSDAFQESAKRWAGYDNQYIQAGQKPTNKYEVVELPNEPFTNLRWVGIDSRMEGGVAYKVVTPQGWLVDLREDVMLECLFEGAIQPMAGLKPGAGTYLTAQFVWVVMGSQSRIVRVGSKLHQELVESTKIRAMTAVPAGDLKAGGVYEDKRGEKHIIIAKVPKKGFLIHRVPVAWSGHRPVPGNAKAEFNKGIRELSIGKGIPSGWNYTKSPKFIRLVEQLDANQIPVEAAKMYDAAIAKVQKEQEKRNAEWNNRHNSGFDDLSRELGKCMKSVLGVMGGIK